MQCVCAAAVWPGVGVCGSDAMDNSGAIHLRDALLSFAPRVPVIAMRIVGRPVLVMMTLPMAVLVTSRTLRVSMSCSPQ